MSNAINYFSQQKQQALGILKKLAEFVRQGAELGMNLHPELVQKVRNGLDAVKDEKLRVALIGGFSEGKTSIAAAWMERLDEASMKISHQESSNEVKVYDVEGRLQLIDTPGLFGFKEQVNTDTMAIEKYKDITKRYVSEAHLVLYVMNSTNSIKESHADDLKWLFRSLNLLPRTVFVLSRFDEVADVADEADYLEKFLVKKSSIAQRLDDVLGLSPEEKSGLSIVAVAANPFDLGTKHWLANLDEFKRLSHIGSLQEATEARIQQSGGALALAHEVKRSIISDIIQKQLPVAREGFETLHEESQRMGAMRCDQEYELGKVSRKISEARISLRGRVIRYFEDLLLQSLGVSLETFNDFFHREIGTEGRLINQRVQEIFSDEVSSITQDLSRIQLKVDSELAHFNNVVLSMGKQGLDYLVKGNVINNQSVLMVRDGIGAAAKAIGLDLGGLLKFKPWGATKFANGLNGALSVLGLALEAWDSYQQEERRRRFEEAKKQLRDNLSRQCQEIVELIDSQNFPNTFFPALAQLEGQLQTLQRELEHLSRRHERFKQWYTFGESIDVEFREVGGKLPPLAPEAAPSRPVQATAERDFMEAISTAASPAGVDPRRDMIDVETRPAKKSLWQRLFS
ncbi:LeoA/HP0731 family dynamin-like GTPase [Azohydromonas lata]|uniref:LeoA/HP0731 family dynamin-like GTPase n=1 Tax=Azohydromonas lata TaxID=45677 RepID=A0ABU5IBF6_9BURK|nr:LeoA/HP0731 family dynamin-like GTPase [Azohydromonas lata]MDZ5455298.1 LeoA/HP0731 family dynamin-like GTPase [Azohydromonas lata]